jgi:hypothetical protein
MKVNDSCSYSKTMSNAISNFFDPKIVNTINQSHLDNVSLLTRAWEIGLLKIHIIN